MGIVNPTMGALGGARGDGETNDRNALQTLLAEFNGNIDQNNVKASFAKDVVEPAFSTWKTLEEVVFLIPPAQPAATIISVIGSASRGLWLDPADLTAGSRVTKYRVAMTVFTNGTAPAANFTAGLYPVTSSGGPGIVLLTPGAVVAGSTAPVNAPAINSVLHAESGAFVAPAAAGYALAVVVSAPTAGNSAVVLTLRLQGQQV